MSAEILLIDDDPLVRTVIADNLSDHGFCVHTAADEAQTFRALRDQPGISLALVDYCLPRPVGIGLCRRIKAEYGEVAVALYTGHGELADVRRGDEALPVLSKALRVDQLVAAIREVLDGQEPKFEGDAMSSRVEILWRQECKRETVTAVGRAMRNQFDRTLKEPLPPMISETVLRLFRARSQA